MMAPLLDEHLQASAHEEWVPALLRGERIVSMAVTEPGSGTDAAAASTAAVRVDGGWRLTGTKTSVGFTPHAAGTLVVARADGDPGGLSAFLVRTNAEGFRQEPFTDLIWRPLGRSRIELDDVFVPDDHVVGPIGGAFRIVLGGFNVGRSVIPLMATAVARRALELTVRHATDRKAFGRPIGSFQGVSFPLAEGAARLEASRWLAYRGLSLAAANRPHATEAAMAKLVGVQAALDVIRDAIIAHGYRGLSEELPLQSMLRDVSGLEIGEGTPQLQKLVIARSLLGRDIA